MEYYLTQELVDKLICRYQTVLKWCKRTPWTWLCILITHITNTSCGVCMCARSSYNTWIYDDKFVAMHCRRRYWTTMPAQCKSKSELLASLQTRIEILQKYEQYERNYK